MVFFLNWFEFQKNRVLSNVTIWLGFSFEVSVSALWAFSFYVHMDVGKESLEREKQVVID
jgi:hypothetical protein